MYASQYEITLPMDYDMGVIRKRVGDTGHILDDRAGLGLKGYLIRERGAGDSPVNQYAPFYLWNDAGAMGQFLFGGTGFDRIIRSFGRPAVHQWTGISRVAGPAIAANPTVATRRLTALPVDPDSDDTGLGLARLVEHEIGRLDALARRDGVHTAALAIDPRHWQLVRFVLWQDGVAEDDDATERYEVLHLSTPGLADLPHGRCW